MSNGTNNLTPRSGNWRSSGRDSATYDNPYHNRDYRATTQSFPRSFSSRSGWDPADRGTQGTWRVIEERVIAGPLALASFNVQQHSPVQILVPNAGRRGESLPRLMGERIAEAFASIPAEGSRLTQDERNKALQKLKKEIYNPVPKRMTSRLSLYYRDRATDALKERARENDDDSKRCAVCLEDFEPKELVMVTPCNHMFHEECIVPWVKSHGQCPVCRLAFFERAQGHERAAPTIATDDIEGELISVIRAMEEAFIRGNEGRW